MDDTLVPIVAGVRFAKVGKIYHFDARHVPDLKIGDQVVVETSRGWQLGIVAQVLPASDFQIEGLKIIDRRATPRDLLMRQTWQAKEREVLGNAKTRAGELGLVGVKIVHAEFSYDGSRLTILFSTESEDKYDLKSLRQDMQRTYTSSQVDLRQIGPRDVAKMMGGMGACGLETRCCSHFLCEFSSISIRMAKEQGISLTPSEITGMCGRLRCCLIYEYEQYTQARSLLPRKNRRVMTPLGEGRVLDQIPIRDSVYVVLMDDQRREFRRSEIQLIDENGGLIPAMSEEERNDLGQETAVSRWSPEEPEEFARGPYAAGRENAGSNRPMPSSRRESREQDQGRQRREPSVREGRAQNENRSGQARDGRENPQGRSGQEYSQRSGAPFPLGEARPSRDEMRPPRPEEQPARDQNLNRPGGKAPEPETNSRINTGQTIQPGRPIEGGARFTNNPKPYRGPRNRPNRPHGNRPNRSPRDRQDRGGGGRRGGSSADDISSE